MEAAITAHFQDHKSLAFAYTELVQAGFSEEKMSASFASAPDAATVPAGHAGLLERLHRLSARVRAHAAAPRHTPHHADSEDADLSFDPGDREDEATAIVGRHGGAVTA